MFASTIGFHQTRVYRGNLVLPKREEWVPMATALWERRPYQTTRFRQGHLRLAVEPCWDRRLLLKHLLALSGTALASSLQVERSAGVPVADRPGSSPCQRPALSAKITDRARFLLHIGDPSEPNPPPIVLGLFGEEAPQAVKQFKQLVERRMSLGGRTLGYAYTTASRIIPDQRIELGRILQSEDLVQLGGVPSKPRLLLSPGTRDRNQLRHRCAGTVSVPHEPGRGFEFCILPVDIQDDQAPFVKQLDAENIVIGRVLEGMETVRLLNALPVSRPTPRDVLRQVGQALGDVRARQDPTWRPLRKVRILECTLLPV
jgi:cyclophilin family peptidyl-prolyl cis-trans isomerase